jgi:hypothetical protein
MQCGIVRFRRIAVAADRVSSALAIPLRRIYLCQMPVFDYAAPAEIFGSGGFSRRRHPIPYRRFNTGAEALRFAVEEIPASLLAGLVMEADENRFDHVEIRALYDSGDYPLERHDPAH